MWSTKQLNKFSLCNGIDIQGYFFLIFKNTYNVHMVSIWHHTDERLYDIINHTATSKVWRNLTIPLQRVSEVRIASNIS